MTDGTDAQFIVECLFCGGLQYLHSNPDGVIPKPGDISICFDCGYVAAYGDDLQSLVPLGREQQEFIETSSEFKAMMFVLRIMKDHEIE